MGDHNIIKTSFESFNELFRVKSWKSKLGTNPLREPPPPRDLIPKLGEQHVNTA